jgi:hypothetical protein
VNLKPILAAAAGLLVTVTALAQPSGPATPGTFRSELRLQLLQFDNFLHSTSPADEMDVTAFAAEYRVAQRLREQPVDLYGHLNLIHYDQSGIDTSFGGRIGGVLQGNRHFLNGYLDHQENRPSFEVGDVFGRADTTNLVVDYSIRLTPDWQLGADGILQQQSFQDRERNNDYNRLGASVRYRGFGRLFSPSIGFYDARRSVRNPNESYDESAWYVQLYSLPRNNLYLSLRYLHRDRDYLTTDPSSRNFGRAEDRGSWTFVVDWRTSERLAWLLYYSTEDVDTTRPGGDFRTGFLMFGPKIRL